MKFAVFCPIVLLTIVAILDTKFVQAVPIARTPGKDSLFADSDVAMTASADPFRLAQSNDIISADESYNLGQLSSSPTSKNHERAGKKDAMLTFVWIALGIVGGAIVIFIAFWFIRDALEKKSAN